MLLLLVGVLGGGGASAVSKMRSMKNSYRLRKEVGGWVGGWVGTWMDR